MAHLFVFVLGVLLLLAGVVVTVRAFRIRRGVIGFAVGGTLSALGLLAIVATTTAIVDARSIGVQTAFGRYVTTLDNGFHVVAPWTDIEQFPTTVQTVDIEGKGNVTVTYSSMEGEPTQTAVGGGKGTFDGNYAWSLRPDGAGAQELWGRYRKFDRVSSELVAPAIRDTIVAVGSSYSAVNAPVSQPAISAKVKTELQKRLNSYGITIDRVSITGIQNDQATQARIDRIIAAQSDIRRAREEKTRAEIDAQTTKIRQQSGALSASGNQRYCLEIVNSWNVSANGPLPATFNCSLEGSGTTPVLVDGTAPKK